MSGGDAGDPNGTTERVRLDSATEERATGPVDLGQAPGYEKDGGQGLPQPSPE